MKRTIPFHPFYTVQIDTDTGQMTGSWDWSDSCDGEWFEDSADTQPTALHVAVCAQLDELVRNAAPPAELPPLAHKFVTMKVKPDGTSLAWGGFAFDTRAECEAKCRELHKRWKDKFVVEEVGG